jgi:hypothetical protein
MRSSSPITQCHNAVDFSTSSPLPLPARPVVPQFYYGGAAATDKAAIKYAIKDAKDATGEYTIVLKD